MHDTGGGINRRLRLIMSASLIGRLGSSTSASESCVVHHAQWTAHVDDGSPLPFWRRPRHVRC